MLTIIWREVKYFVGILLGFTVPTTITFEAVFPILVLFLLWRVFENLVDSLEKERVRRK